ncbi:hypothetical protein SAMN05444358_1048 [Ruegeria halocynthiae]|uniref:Uncharacterized protein n=1 Tax=Ruegeria halocynthiae TaxID=985054 RepID=A0A1H3A3V1_9RHOB|nr:hypothetical protein SAMN05444358_1048 [Ruegeria halocynthiae]
MRAVASEFHGLRTAGLHEHTVLCSDEERRITTAVAIGKKKRRKTK